MYTVHYLFCTDPSVYGEPRICTLYIICLVQLDDCFIPAQHHVPADNILIPAHHFIFMCIYVVFVLTLNYIHFYERY